MLITNVILSIIIRAVPDIRYPAVSGQLPGLRPEPDMNHYPAG